MEKLESSYIAGGNVMAQFLWQRFIIPQNTRVAMTQKLQEKWKCMSTQKKNTYAQSSIIHKSEKLDTQMSIN